MGRLYKALADKHWKRPWLEFPVCCMRKQLGSKVKDRCSMRYLDGIAACPRNFASGPGLKKVLEVKESADPAAVGNNLALQVLRHD